MVDVAIVGVGQTKYGVFPEKDMKSLFVEAFMEAIADVKKGIDPKAIQEAFIGTLETGGNQLGNVSSLMVEQVHMPHIPARRVENACASSGFAFRDAYLAVKTGRYDLVVAGGVEKMTDLPR